MSGFLGFLIDGAMYAAWLFLIAVGLTLIFGVMGILNMAHGSFYAFGAYTAAMAVGVWLGTGRAPLVSYLVLIVAGIVAGSGRKPWSTAVCFASCAGGSQPRCSS